MKNNYKKIFNKKKVLITGHTGFKGSWLALWMHYLGANVMGISKNIPTNPSHFNAIGLKNIINSKKIDIKNDKLLNSSIKKFKPDFIFHLAAQAIVKKSYFNSLETWKSNLLGTINLLESLKLIKKEVIVVLITSDKVYKNLEVKRGYKEQDILGGIDPYGASKSATEIAIKSYINSFFSSKRNKILITTARAGNVIGGGDWSENRLLPDCIRSWSKGKKVIIRNPKSTRPWQHVLDCLSGYLLLGHKLLEGNKYCSGPWNFGPIETDSVAVKNIVQTAKKYFPSLSVKFGEASLHETETLQLNCNKARNQLNWKPIWGREIMFEKTFEWYKEFYLEQKVNTEKQLEDYLKAAVKEKLSWAK